MLLSMPCAILDQLDTFGPQHCDTLNSEQASAYARDLVKTQYENFSVISRLLPKRLRDDFCHLYAFCRWADDLADETADPQRSLELLAWWRNELDLCYDGSPRHPVYVALASTIEKYDIPRKPFDDLIDAFVTDQTTTRYDSFEQVVDYCTGSADPVGRLVLYLAGHRDSERQGYSDATCTALQLANFWQDVRRDILERDRVYIPRDIALKHNLDIELMVKIVKIDDRKAEKSEDGGCGCGKNSGCGASGGVILPAYRAVIQELAGRTRVLFAEGRQLWPMLERDMRRQIKLFTYGGEAILRLIERQHYNTLTQRPSLSRAAKLVLILRAMI